MKKFLTVTAALFMGVVLFAQSPQRLSYQAVIRNAAGKLIQSSNVGMRVSILQGSATGTAVYTETFTAMTNANGLITLQIGEE